MGLDYTWEKLYVAVDALASGTDRLQERLANAYVSALIRLEPADFPEEDRETFRELERSLTCVAPKGNEGSVAATTAVMDDEQARQLAGSIVSLYDHVARKQRW